ncbi:MAG: radical SAM protein, partial [Bacteroidota bacterium]
AKRNKKWVSLNYFVFPGITDSIEEYEALRKIISEIKPDMIQWRNFNTDPEFYLDLHKKMLSTPIGMKKLLDKIHKEFPLIRFGYFNPFLG